MLLYSCNSHVYYFKTVKRLPYIIKLVKYIDTHFKFSRFNNSKFYV